MICHTAVARIVPYNTVTRLRTETQTAGERNADCIRVLSTTWDSFWNTRAILVGSLDMYRVAQKHENSSVLHILNRILPNKNFSVKNFTSTFHFKVTFEQFSEYFLKFLFK